MIHCSMAQALSVWSDLEVALAGTNKFGGDTAEIYAYRLQEYSPYVASGSDGPFTREAKLEAAQRASDTIAELLKHFAKTRSAKIWVDGISLSRWKRMPEPHRFHVKVTPRK